MVVEAMGMNGIALDRGRVESDGGRINFLPNSHIIFYNFLSFHFLIFVEMEIVISTYPFSLDKHEVL